MSDRLTPKRVDLLKMLAAGELSRRVVSPYYPTLHWLIEKGYVECETAPIYFDDTYRITSAGRETLARC